VKPTLIEKIRGKDLPPEWAEKADVQPEEEVQVLIGPGRRAAAKALLRSMERLGTEAKRQGLTEAKLAELLQDES